MPTKNKEIFSYCLIPVLIGIVVTLSACDKVGDKSLTSNRAALPTMENIALNARSCWFRSQDKQFANYKLAPELKSYSDRPRILIVPYTNPNDRPLLVVEASGNPAKIEAYGPLLQSKLAKKIDKDLQNWSKGDNKC